MPHHVDSEVEKILTEKRGIMDLAKELADLRKRDRDIRLLREKLNRAQGWEHEYFEISDTLDRTNSLVDDITRLKHAYRPVHHIALRAIFEATLPPPGILDPSVCLGPDSPWCRAIRMTKSLILVCKSWREVALPLLYRNVVLRRVGQLSALVRTLEADPQGYSNLIQSITFMCYVPEGYGQLVSDNTARILQYCKNIRALSLTTAVQHLTVPPTDFNTHHIQDTSNHTVVKAMQNICLNVSSLEFSKFFGVQCWGYDPLPRCIVPTSFIAMFRNLVSLTLSLPLGPPELEPDSNCLPVSLEKLEKLSLLGFNIDRHFVLLMQWHLPRLWRVILILELIPTLHIPFFTKFGHGIRDLDCGMGLDSASSDAINLCPTLEYLTLGDYAGDDSTVFKKLPSLARLRQVDIWANLPLSREIIAKISHLPPVLRSNVRIIDKCLWPIPSALCPELTDGPGPKVLIHRTYGPHIMQTKWCLVRWDGGKWIQDQKHLRDTLICGWNTQGGTEGCGDDTEEESDEGSDYIYDDDDNTSISSFQDSGDEDAEPINLLTELGDVQFGIDSAIEQVSDEEALNILSSTD